MAAPKQLGFGEAPAAYMLSERPTALGLARRITYLESNSLLTETSGFMKDYKFSINPYSGCGFGCEYCYARFFAPTPEERDTWGSWVKVKENAVELIGRAARSKSERAAIREGDCVYLSTVTDPYQPIEQKLELTRAVLEALIPIQPRLTIQTRSPISTRDIDLFRQFARIRVNYTITTDSEEVRLRYEPHCPSIEVRLKAAEEVAAAGVPIGISVSPLLPINDPEAFGERIAAMHAAEYVTQAFKDPRSRFSAGTTVEALSKAREDGWGRAEYERTREILARKLGSGRRLLEGAEGYAPA